MFVSQIHNQPFLSNLQDMRGTVESISRFLQINLTHNQIQDIANKNTYSNKKQSAEGDKVEQMVLGNRGKLLAYAV